MRITVTDFDFEEAGLTVNRNDPNFSEIAVNYLQDNYFNGADNAVIYLGECYNKEFDYTEYEFDLIPN